MSDYIRRDDALKGQKTGTFANGICLEAKACVPVDYIESLEPADVAPVAHSRWIKTADGAECEKCGREAVYQIIDDHWQYEPFCPHCGAKMDGGKNT